MLINLNLIGEDNHNLTPPLSRRDVMLGFLYKIDNLNIFWSDQDFLLNYTLGFVDADFWLDGFSDSNNTNVTLQYLAYYYYHISGGLNLKKSLHNLILTKSTLKYFLILRNNQDKMKYSLTNLEGQTYVTMSIGIILKYFETFKKSIKKSIKAHTLMLRFIKNTITKMVRQDGYIFIVRGVSLRLFKLINFFNFCKKSSKMSLYVLQPKHIFKKTIGKKVKSIKRKLQKKNFKKININFQISKKINKGNFII